MLIIEFRTLLLLAVTSLLGLGMLAGRVRGQSSDQMLPTPVLSSEIAGRIAALDLGDPRLTRHFYAFEAAPGDLLITIDHKNLDGDMDVFTSVTFRPLMKTTLYANSRAGEITKGLYLRTSQILILRVEARTPNDEAGTYHVRFGGSFKPFSGGIPVADNAQPQADAAIPDRGSKRLSSVGATITEPVVAVPAVTTESKPGAENEKPAEVKAATRKSTAKSSKERSSKPTPAPRNTRARARPPRPKPATPESDAAKSSTAKPEEVKKEGVPGEKEKAATPDAERSSTPAKEAEAPAKEKAQELPLPGAHLIIESKDGTKIDRPMSTVRRVVVEGGVIVIVLKTGHIERIPMSSVARMAIEP